MLITTCPSRSDGQMCEEFRYSNTVFVVVLAENGRRMVPVTQRLGVRYSPLGFNLCEIKPVGNCFARACRTTASFPRQIAIGRWVAVVSR